MYVEDEACLEQEWAKSSGLSGVNLRIAFDQTMPVSIESLEEAIRSRLDVEHVVCSNAMPFESDLMVIRLLAASFRHIWSGSSSKFTETTTCTNALQHFLIPICSRLSSRRLRTGWARSA